MSSPFPLSPLFFPNMKHPHQSNQTAPLSFFSNFSFAKNILRLAADTSGKIRNKEGKEEEIWSLQDCPKIRMKYNGHIK